MRIYRSNRPGLSGGGKEYPPANPETAKRYVNESHEWMDVNILHGRYPDLYGFLILMEHSIPAEEIWDQLKLWSEQYIEFGENRTRICHRIIDRIIEYQLETDKQDGYPPPYCHRGCSNCCYQAVACTDEEAELIYNYCIENRIYIDFAKLERQQKHMEFDSKGNFTGKTGWDTQPEGDKSCIFLNMDDQNCSIWDHRPLVCRVHLAEETDAYCRSGNGTPDTRAKGIHYPECSYIMSSIFTIHHDSIGKMLGGLLLAYKTQNKKDATKPPFQ
jgi:Fe-S-cluster containining protein